MHKPAYLILALISLWTFILVIVISRLYFSARLRSGDSEIPGLGKNSTDIQPLLRVQSKFRDAVTALGKEDAVLGQTEAGRACSQEFGVDVLERWKHTQIDVCNGFGNGSHITCFRREPFDMPRLLCTATNSLVRMHPPYYETYSDERGPPGELQLQFNDGVLNVNCELGVYNVLPGDWWSWKQTRSVAPFMNNIRTLKSLPCTSYVNHTVFWMRRYDYKNLFHVLEDLVTTFETLLVLNEDPANVELAIYDGFPHNNALFDLWTQIFGAGVRIVRENPFPVGTCFQKSIINMFAGRSHLSNGKGVSGKVKCASPILKSMTSWIKSLFEEPTDVSANTNDTEVNRILWISRQNYGNRTIGRVIPNEAQILSYLKARLPTNWTLETFRPELLSSMKQQISILSSARVLIGVHGAGLANLVFLPNSNTSHVIEIFHSDRSDVNRHYINMCKWLDITYHRTAYYSRIVSVRGVWTILEEILRKEGYEPNAPGPEVDKIPLN